MVRQFMLSVFKVSHVTMLLDCAMRLGPLEHQKNRTKSFAVVTRQFSALSGRFGDIYCRILSLIFFIYQHIDKTCSCGKSDCLIIKQVVPPNELHNKSSLKINNSPIMSTIDTAS